MSYFKITGFALLSLTAIVLLRRMKEEYAMFVSLVAGVFLTLTALSLLEPVLSYAANLGKASDAGIFIPLILKSSGVAVISATASDLCKDSGESALGNKLELCGKALILSLALPLIKNVFDSCLLLLG